MKINKIEKRVAWWNEISAGVGLVLGYIFYFSFWLLTPETIIEIEVVQPEYAEVEIGKIPEEITLKNYPLIESLNQLDRTKKILRKVPQFNENGTPKLNVSIQKFKGLGEPDVKSEKVEILIPKLSSPNFNYVVFNSPRDKKKYWVKFYPNEYLQGTGSYYERKVVYFSGGKSADIFAIRTATFFGIVSFVLFILKIRLTTVDWLKKCTAIKFDSEYFDD